MGAFLLSAAVAVAIFIAVLLLMPSHISSDEERRKRSVLDQMAQQTFSGDPQGFGNTSILREERLMLPAQGIKGLLGKLPGVKSTFDLMIKAGLEKHYVVFFLFVLLFFIIMDMLLSRFGVWGLIGALFITFIATRKYLSKRIRKRSEQFLNLFPDAVDMIIRSVRSGHPLNAAMKMISTNMDDPLKSEFKQVVDEIAYGRTLPEALLRMAGRIDEPDLHFFVVVLSVQQETGGSLAEVLSNLSNVIRKRRQLRMKIQALTSEGRATSYILGALPVLVFTAIYYTSPSYMVPLFTTPMGNILLATSASLIVGAIWLVRIMINIDI